MKKYIIIAFLIKTTILFSHPVVENLDIQKFMGRWYVIALIPNWIEGDGRNSYDDYVLNQDGTVDIRYYAISDGKEKSIRQKGFVDKEKPSRWEIQFLKPYIPFYKAPYEVIILDSDYQYMVVGYPNNKFGWVMGRSTDMSDMVYQKILDQLEVEFGYERAAFKRAVHDN